MSAPIRNPLAPLAQILHPKLGQLSMTTSRLRPQDRTSFPSLRRRRLRATPRQELYKVKSFPHALCRLSSPPEPASQPICTGRRELWSGWRAPAGATGSQKNHVKNPHAPLPPRAIHRSTRRFLGGLPLPELQPRASWPPSRCRCRARSALVGTRPASRGAWRLGHRRRHAGSQAEEGNREERNGSGRRGTGGGGARSKSAAQITAQPAGRSADSPVGSELLPLPSLLLAASLLPAPHHSRRRRTAKPLSLVSPSRFSLTVSSSQTAGEKGEGERRLVRDD